MAATVIHFRGLDDTLEAFENRGVEAWSIFSGRNMNFKGTGKEELREMLETLKRGCGSSAFALKVYEGVSDAEEIKSNTPDSGSFMFVLNEPVNRYNPEVAMYKLEQNQQRISALDRIAETNAHILQRLEALENREAEEEEEEEKPNNLGVIGDILGHPSIAPVAPMLVESVIKAIVGAFGGGTDSPQRAPAPAATTMGALGTIPSPATTDDEREIASAIAVLKEHDEKLPEHLKKLARIATADPGSFKFLLTSLEAIQA